MTTLDVLLAVQGGNLTPFVQFGWPLVDECLRNHWLTAIDNSEWTSYHLTDGGRKELSLDVERASDQRAEVEVCEVAAECEPAGAARGGRA